MTSDTYVRDMRSFNRGARKMWRSAAALFITDHAIEVFLAKRGFPSHIDKKLRSPEAAEDRAREYFCSEDWEWVTNMADVDIPADVVMRLLTSDNIGANRAEILRNLGCIEDWR